jgi:predicted RNA methylase
MEVEMLALIVFLIFLLIMIWPRVLNYAEYWPTSLKKARKMLKIAKLKKNEGFYDLGCGDGRFVIIAAKEFNANAAGIELDPFRYSIAKLLSFFLTKNAKIRFGNYLNYDFSDADVIALFLKPKPMAKLEKKLKNLKKGTRIISYMWKFPNIKPVYEDKKEKIYLYVIK